MKKRKVEKPSIVSPKASNSFIAKRAVLFGVILGLSAVATMAIIRGSLHGKSIKVQAAVPVEKGVEQYPYIYPTTFAGPPSEIRPFKEKIERLVQGIKAQGKASSVSVYFRSMRNGYAFGINPQEKYYPASLLKVPLMMAYLKAGMADLNILVKKVKYDKVFQDMPSNNIPDKLVLGKEYTVSELIVRMVINSDNDATMLLNNHLSHDFYTSTLKELELNIPQLVAGSDNYLNIVDYSRIWRILYNSSYLDQNNSNHALMLLTKAIFAEGIPTGTPGKTVAHKFGEWASNGTIQLHDCGIVYDGDATYLLSIMTKGKNRAALASVISDISKSVQGYVHETVPMAIP